MWTIIQNAWLMMGGTQPFTFSLPSDPQVALNPITHTASSSHHGPYTHGGAWSEAFVAAKSLVAEMTLEEKVVLSPLPKA